MDTTLARDSRARRPMMRKAWLDARPRRAPLGGDPERTPGARSLVLDDAEPDKSTIAPVISTIAMHHVEEPIDRNSGELCEFA